MRSSSCTSSYKSPTKSVQTVPKTAARIDDAKSVCSARGLVQAGSIYRFSYPIRGSPTKSVQAVPKTAARIDDEKSLCSAQWNRWLFETATVGTRITSSPKPWKSPQKNTHNVCADKR